MKEKISKNRLFTTIVSKMFLIQIKYYITVDYIIQKVIE